MIWPASTGDSINDLRQVILVVILHRYAILEPSYFGQWFPLDLGGFQLLDLIITELKSHMTCYNSKPLIIGWNNSIQTGEQIL